MDLQRQFNQYRLMLDAAQVGWWEAHFAGKYYICSEYVVKLLGISCEILTFNEFRDLIHADYRNRISSEFLSIQDQEVYEQVFPIHTQFGVKWVRSKLYQREVNDQGELVGYGILQIIPDQKDEFVNRNSESIQINRMLNHLGSLSRSLFSFLQNDDLDHSIQEVLTETLSSFDGVRGRAYLMELDYEKRTFSCSFEYCSEGVEPLKRDLQELPWGNVPCFIDKIINNHPVIIDAIDDLDSTFVLEKALLVRKNVSSLMLIPMPQRNHPGGFFGIDIVDTPRMWTHEDYQWLLSVSNLICIITELLKAHDALDRNEKLLRNIYMNIPVGIEIYDRNGYLKDLNMKDMEIFGIRSKEDVIGINIFENPVIPLDVLDEMRRKMPVTFRFNYPFERLDGYYTTVKQGCVDIITKVTMLYDSRGELISYLLINIDNTENLLAYNRIEEFQNIFVLVGNLAKVGYAKFDLISREGYAVDQWYRNLGEKEGTPLHEVIGVYNHLHPDDQAEMIHFFELVKQGKAEHIRKELRIKSGDSWKWTRVNVMRNIQNQEPGRLEMLCINYDVTELKENQLQREKAEELDRLKSAFLANMSHEIRTPLNAIVGFSSLLADTEEQEERRQYIEIIEQNNDLLLQLISDVLDLAKIESNTIEFRFSEVDLQDVFYELHRSFQIKMPEGVRLIAPERLEPCVLYTDRTRIMQVMSNFINNAVKYTAQGFIKLDYERLPSDIRCSVTDTGEGMSPEVQEHIFDRFYKGNSFKQGTGLGLSICETIVKKLGGEIGVISEIGKGSTFWFTIPIKPPHNKEEIL